LTATLAVAAARTPCEFDRACLGKADCIGSTTCIELVVVVVVGEGWAQLGQQARAGEGLGVKRKCGRDGGCGVKKKKAGMVGWCVCCDCVNLVE
jgi:hypothetical protein